MMFPQVLHAGIKKFYGENRHVTKIYLDGRLFFLNSVKCILKPDKFLFRYKKEGTSLLFKCTDILFEASLHTFSVKKNAEHKSLDFQSLLFLIERFYWRHGFKRQSNGILACWLADAI